MPASEVGMCSQEFMGSVVEARWEESGAWVEVVARVPLEAGTQLSEGLLLLGRSSASVLTTHCLQALHCLQAAQAGPVQTSPASSEFQLPGCGLCVRT